MGKAEQREPGRPPEKDAPREQKTRQVRFRDATFHFPRIHDPDRVIGRLQNVPDVDALEGDRLDHRPALLPNPIDCPAQPAVQWIVNTESLEPTEKPAQP